MSSSALLRPLAESELSEKAVETLNRIRELFGEEPVPEAFFLYANVPAFMHDFYMNFKRFVMTAGKLDLKTKLLVAYSAAVVLGSRDWRDYLSTKLKATGVEESTIAAAAAIAGTCSMYNAFFKFRDLAGIASFQTMPVGLRAFAFTNSGLDDKTVETINIAVSDLNACRPCTSGHVAKAVSLGVSEEAILEAVQAAATIAAGAVFMRGAY
jgi:lipoyl-dependent peroxiredoxin subunit D